MASITPAQAARLFLLPQKKPGPSAPPGWPGAQRADLLFEGLKLAVWRAEPETDKTNGPPVFLLHGWEGSSADMAPFVTPLLNAGFPVIALDLPAHGASEGQFVSLFECTRAVRQLLDESGPLRALIAHSAGCPVAIEAIRAGLRVGAAVLIGSPARYRDQACLVARQLGLGDAGARLMLAELKTLGVDVTAIDTPRAVRALNVPGLVIHAEDDRIIAHALGKEVASAWPGARFMSVNGCGHRRILSSPEVIAAAVAFAKEAQ